MNYFNLKFFLGADSRYGIISHEQMLQGYLGVEATDIDLGPNNENILHILFNKILYYVLCYLMLTYHLF